MSEQGPSAEERMPTPLERAIAAGAPPEVIDRLRERESGSNTSDNLKTSPDTSEPKSVFLGVDKDGNEAEQQRYEELMEMADDLFEVNFDENGHIIMSVNEANRTDVMARLDTWYDKYETDFPDPTTAEQQALLEEIKSVQLEVARFQHELNNISTDSSDPNIQTAAAACSEFLGRDPKTITKVDIDKIRDIIAQTSVAASSTTLKAA